MSNVAIRVEGLGKRYRLGERAPYKTIRETITRAAAAPFRALGNRARVETPPQNSQHIWALKDVSLEVKRGEAVGIVGRNGSGKSTLLKILARITEPTTGWAEIHGRVGALLEVGTGFHPELTGRENVYLNGAILGMSKAEIRRRFDEIVAFAEIEKFIDTPVKRYSSGMYVRLAFAVAAHLEPEILLVDEVLAVGDVQFQRKCLSKMTGVLEEGRTVAFVSHSANAVQVLCRRAILLDAGHVVCDGLSESVIYSYIGRSTSHRMRCVWEEPSRRPGNEHVRLRSVEVQPAGEQLPAAITTDAEFVIQMEYEVSKEGVCVGATVVLYTGDGMCVLSSMTNHDREWHRRPRPVGIYRSRCSFPGSLLSEGEYSVSVILWEDDYRLVCREDRVVSFQVRDGGLVRGDYQGGWGGVVRPLLRWCTHRVRAQVTEVRGL